jgi:hypothetical protein
VYLFLQCRKYLNNREDNLDIFVSWYTQKETWKEYCDLEGTHEFINAFCDIVHMVCYMPSQHSLKLYLSLIASKFEVAGYHRCKYLYWFLVL